MQALGGTPTQTSPQSSEEDHQGVLPLLNFMGAGRSFAVGFCRARFFPWDMRSSKALLKTSWKSATSHVKNWGGFPPPSPPQHQEAVCTVCNTSKYLIQRKHVPCETSQPKKKKKKGVNLGTTFPLRWQSLLRKIWEHASWLGKTLTSVMCDVRVGKGNTQLKYHCF